MDPALYKASLQVLVSQAHVLLEIDTPAMLEAIDRADTLGPILNPTLWMLGHNSLDQVRTVVQAADTFRRTLLRLKPEALLVTP